MADTNSTECRGRTGIPVLGLAQWLGRRAARAPLRPALSCDETTWSYGELQARIERLSAVLQSCGVGRGVCVGYLGFNDPMFLVTMFATARLGGIFVPMNFRLTGLEHAFIINDAGVEVLFADGDHVPVIDGVRDRLCCRRYLRVGGDSSGWESLDVLLSAAGPIPPLADVEPDDTALVMYTSGTTGNPKGAMLTHGNFWANNLNAEFCMELRSDDVSLNFAPLFHVGGLCSNSLVTLMMGGHLVLQRGFDAGEVMRAVQRYRVTITFAVPAMLLFMSQHDEFERADLSSLRLIAVGGAPMPKALLRLYAERGIPVHQGYGMTETTSTITFLSPERSRDKLGSCGTAALMNEFRIVDVAGRALTEPESRGEVCVRGSNVMKGYWNRPDATADAFDDDGWFRTGDIGYVDDEGFLYLCDRLKDMIITGGENVYPAEVEGVLYSHPSIAEIAVIGAPDERWGEHVVAVAVLKRGATLTLEQLQEHAGRSLARYKLPRELRIVDELPRNPTGKVLKGRLRNQSGFR